MWEVMVEILSTSVNHLQVKAYWSWGLTWSLLAQGRRHKLVKWGEAEYIKIPKTTVVSMTAIVFDHVHRDSINKKSIYSWCMCAVSLTLLTVAATDSST